MKSNTSNPVNATLVVALSFLNVPQAAQALGVHKNTIWKLIRDGKLPAVRIGSKIVRINPADLAALATPYVGGEYGQWSSN